MATDQQNGYECAQSVPVGTPIFVVFGQTVWTFEVVEAIPELSSKTVKQPVLVRFVVCNPDQRLRKNDGSRVGTIDIYDVLQQGAAYTRWHDARRAAEL